jgi:hypothetical protein
VIRATRGVIGPLRVATGFALGRQVGVGHGRDLALHLVEDQQAVGQHPAAIGGASAGLACTGTLGSIQRISS